MALNESAAKLRDRIATLLSRFSDPKASTAQLLCDRHDPSAVAYTLVGPGFSSADLSYGVLREESERLASALFMLGLRAGDRVATLMDKSRAYLLTVMAIWRLGAVHVPLFTAFAPPAIAYRLNGSAAKAVVCDSVQQAKLAPSDAIPVTTPWRIITTATSAEQISNAISFWDLLDSHSLGFPAAVLGGDAPIIQIYTSGTTGKPKGVVVPLRALASFYTYVEYALDVRPDDVFWNAADPGWAYGLYFGVLAAFMTGVRSVLLEGGFSAERTFEVLARFGVTNFACSPTVLRSLRACGMTPAAGMKVRCVSSAGEPLTDEVNEWAAATLGVLVHDHYGQTETGMLINNHQHPALRRPLKPHSMGSTMPGWTAVVLRDDLDELAPVGEIGRLAVDLTRSPLAWFRGYIDEPAMSADKFSEDGRWYITGDVGRKDDEDYFYFSSRDDDVIIMAGYRIGPFEVESVLATHPAIIECAVVAVPDQIRGELLVATVVLRQGYVPSEELTKELQERVKRLYAAHAYPRHIHYPEALPKTPSGKIQRYLIREQMRAQISQRGSQRDQINVPD